MQLYCESLTEYKRLQTVEVKVGDLLLGNGHPIRVQTMTTTDTMDTAATVAQTIRCIEAGAELVRITAPSKKEAENLLHIKNALRAQGYTTPLVADIHFTPNAAEIAARLIEKVRVNPGNYVDKKKFELIEYTDADYAEEIDRIRERFTPLVKICRDYGTAMRIGTNHGSLSDRIMSRYGDTPMGMVESAMEFLRIARGESYHNIVLSMKSSNPQVMVQAYRLLVKTMYDEFGVIYPLHLGVTEAGDGEDGRIKSAVGIGTLLQDGIGDTIRVSLTEDPELEIPVCKDLVKRYQAPPPPKGGIEEAAYGYQTADPMLFVKLKEFVKEHRSVPTEAENILWECVRDKKLNGYKFRRQHIIGAYIADFVCLQKNLVVEVDGAIHQLPENKISDAERTAWLNEKGFEVLHFSNQQVIQQTEKTLQQILQKLQSITDVSSLSKIPPLGGGGASFNPFEYKRRDTFAVQNIGGGQVPVVVADLSKLENITPDNLQSIGYTYNAVTDKWQIGDAAADFIFTGHHILDFELPGTLKVIVYPNTWEAGLLHRADNESALLTFKEKYYPIYQDSGYVKAVAKSAALNFVMVDCFNDETPLNDFTHLDALANDPTVVICLSSTNANASQSIRRMAIELMARQIKNPVVLLTDSNWQTADEHLIHYAAEAGALLLDGIGDGVCFGMSTAAYQTFKEEGISLSGRRYTSTEGAEHFINNTAFSLLQATRTRISKTEYISCPSCGRTLFDLQETTAKIRAVTNHLKGVKIAIMGCIVNGPGEMADADFGYVGSGPGKITLYKSKEVVKRNVPSEVAVDELINLLKESGAWVEKEVVAEQV